MAVIKTQYGFVFFIITVSLISSNNGAIISVELIHRDSPKSPLYSSSQTPWQRIAMALQRSTHRSANHFHHYLTNKKNTTTTSSSSSAQSELFPSGGEYLINISIGTPPFPILAIADTGSDLMWTQCQPCPHCFKQKGPLFQPNSSSTFHLLSCKSEQCKNLDDDGPFCNADSSCRYTYSYGDSSYTSGTLALETLTFSASSPDDNDPVLSFPSTIFGFGFQNGGAFSGLESGIIGLVAGKLSLISQMGSSINGKFSYCLVPASLSPSPPPPPSSSSKLYFGGSSFVPGTQVSTTPLLTNIDFQSYYYLALEAVSIENVKFELTKKGAQGNMIIDSGTLLTYLPTKLYKALETMMRKSIKNLEFGKDPNGYTSLCYKTKSDDIDALGFTFHFEDGGDVELKSVINTFLRVTEDVLCFAFAPTDLYDLLIFGNVAQANFLVQYDLTGKLLSFKPVKEIGNAEEKEATNVQYSGTE
ncbi:aspartic proteinase CDR1-like [Humulus lupulus]|uniref:aspartic proteinase CDR1-like n=1 Tax=Humulus lupulus TaxID=3486 RepID=UPI002B40EB73|nr:aspartic proteinase CDR1-like [Humulus lupulus]